jgi:hypothetical protein
MHPKPHRRTIVYLARQVRGKRTEIHSFAPSAEPSPRKACWVESLWSRLAHWDGARAGGKRRGR